MADVKISYDLADRYNGLALKIMSGVAQDAPKLLEVIVHPINIEMPGDERLIEQVLE
jgi:hypothetical protein